MSLFLSNMLYYLQYLAPEKAKTSWIKTPQKCYGSSNWLHKGPSHRRLSNCAEQEFHILKSRNATKNHQHTEVVCSLVVILLNSCSSVYYSREVSWHFAKNNSKAILKKKQTIINLKMTLPANTKPLNKELSSLCTIEPTCVSTNKATEVFSYWLSQDMHNFLLQKSTLCYFTKSVKTLNSCQNFSFKKAILIC